MGVDVLISGHTHVRHHLSEAWLTFFQEFAAYEKDGRIFLNPGTATGAYSGFQV